MNIKERWIKDTYMRLLDLYDFLEVYPNDIDKTLEMKALEIIYKIHEDEISALEKGGASIE